MIERRLGQQHDVEIENRATAFDGFSKVDVYHLRFRRYDGTWSRRIEREQWSRGNAVAVLPYDPLQDRIILVEQFRLAAMIAGRNPWQLEVVAGGRGPSETWEEVARREVLEEAGCTMRVLLPICDFMSSPGTGPDAVHLFYGELDSSGGEFHGVAEEEEDIRVLSVDFDESQDLLAKGWIENATTIIALQWLAANRARLRAAARADIAAGS